MNPDYVTPDVARDAIDGDRFWIQFVVACVLGPRTMTHREIWAMRRRARRILRHEAVALGYQDLGGEA